jgi:hypothetical protein
MKAEIVHCHRLSLSSGASQAYYSQARVLQVILWQSFQRIVDAGRAHAIGPMCSKSSLHVRTSPVNGHVFCCQTQEGQRPE